MGFCKGFEECVKYTERARFPAELELEGFRRKRATNFGASRLQLQEKGPLRFKVC